MPTCQRFGIGVIPFASLASGLLTGKYRRDAPPPPGTRLAGHRFANMLTWAPWDTIEALQRSAAERGLGLVDMAIGGLAGQPAVASVIAGATRPEQFAPMPRPAPGNRPRRTSRRSPGSPGGGRAG